MSELDLGSLGKPAKEIEVKFNIRSIQLFSDGLYSSPHKAIEELVSNSYDAGARNVHVVLREATLPSGSIMVVDDGIGMDDEAIRKHWLIGESNKRDETYVPPLGRAPIGKFGIGKLATYVLANKFHLVSKARGKFWVATMDYLKMIDEAARSGAPTEQHAYRFWVRTLSESQARSALEAQISGDGPAYDAIRLFGPHAAKTWTAALLSDLRPLSAQIQTGMTRWVLSTALPLKSDFKIFLNGNEVESSKEEADVLETWQLGTSFVPDIDGLVSYDDPSKVVGDPEKVGVQHPALKRVYGSFTLYKDIISEGKSGRFGRSHGFFVYVRGRLLNESDAYFGIPENTLRHGTFSRFRMDVHIDELDEELRSSRETYKETSNVDAARDLLKLCFAHARAKQHAAEEAPDDSSHRIVDRLARSPRSVTTTPMLSMLRRTLDGRIKPRLSRIDIGEDGPAAVMAAIQARADENILFRGVAFGETLLPSDEICEFEAAAGVLNINTQHPFVAHFVDEPIDKRGRALLELLATSEVLLEASLYENIRDESTVYELLRQRETLLRSLAQRAENRSPSAVATRLVDASIGWQQFELALVDAFNAMGFDARRVSGNGRPDGIAEARLTPVKGGESRAYAVSLEAKQHKRNVSKDEAKPLTVARHRDKFNCNHAVIVARAFTEGEEAALSIEVRSQNEADRLRFEKLAPDDRKRLQQARTLTLARVEDIASLVRLFSYKRIRLDTLRELFDCVTPEEVAKYVAEIKASAPNRKHFREILTIIDGVQKEKNDLLLEYGVIELELHRQYNIDLDPDEIRNACYAMELMSNELIHAADRHVELNSHVDQVTAAIAKSLNELPESERPVARAALEIDTSPESVGRAPKKTHKVRKSTRPKKSRR